MGLFNHTPTATLTLRVMARLLSYPDDELRANLNNIATALRSEGALSQQRLIEIDALVDRLGRLPALEAEAEYVELFDRGRSTSLHLFEHVHGDSRDRGPAMIDLAKTYEAAGLYLAPGELPDYLPVALEFASSQPPKEARDFLAEMADILNALFFTLTRRQSPYAAVLAALVELSGEEVQAVKSVQDEPLDASWAEPEAFAGCSSRGQSKGEQPVHLVRNPSASKGVQA